MRNLAREHGERGHEAWALWLLGELECEPGLNPLRAAESYGEALETATSLEMRPLVAHCHLGLGKLYGRMGHARAGPRAPHDRGDDVPRDGHAVLSGAGGGKAATTVNLPRVRRRGAPGPQGRARLASIYRVVVASSPRGVDQGPLSSGGRVGPRVASWPAHQRATEIECSSLTNLGSVTC